MRLAALMGRTVRELGDSMGSDELSRWMAFEALYGLPDAYFITGQICATLAACLGDGKKKVGPADFVAYFRDAKPSQTSADHMHVMQGLGDPNR